MSFLADLHRAVQATLKSQRLGTLVFVRYQLQSVNKNAALRLAQMLTAVRDWMGRPVERVYSAGSAKTGVSLTVEFQGGATALISWALAPPRGNGVDLMVIGNHGVLYHDAGIGKLWDEPPGVLTEKPDEALVTLVERALRSGQPEAAGKGAP